MVVGILVVVVENLADPANKFAVADVVAVVAHGDAVVDIVAVEAANKNYIDWLEVVVVVVVEDEVDIVVGFDNLLVVVVDLMEIARIAVAVVLHMAAGKDAVGSVVDGEPSLVILGAVGKIFLVVLDN